jgi:hypothetical protein
MLRGWGDVDSRARTCGMRRPDAREGRFQHAAPGKCGLFWSFSTMQLLCLGLDAVAGALNGDDQRIFDPAAMRAALVQQSADPPPNFFLLALASAGPCEKPIWHAGPVSSSKGRGLAVTLMVDARTVETIAMAVHRRWPMSGDRVGAETP